MKKTIREERPDLVMYFENSSDADVLTLGSHKKASLVCPICKTIRHDMSVCVLVRGGFKCKICKTGKSIPERFCSNVLSQLKVEYEREKSFAWSKKKRYDFYIENASVIIEVHGMQHYSERYNWNNKTNTIENDTLKREVALNNGVIKYIEIDCRYSKKDWLVQNFQKSLGNVFELKNIDWNSAFLYAISNLEDLLKVAEVWNDRNSELENSRTLAKKTNMTVSSFYSYLKYCSSVGLCEYDGTLERFISISKVGKLNKRQIHRYTIGGEYIDTFESAESAHELTKINRSSITNCLNGVYRTAGNFRWSHDRRRNLDGCVTTRTKNNKILQYRKDGEFIKEWKNIGEIKKEFGNISKIYECMNNKRKTANGYVWRYSNIEVEIVGYVLEIEE